MPLLLPTQMLLGRECTLEDELIAHAAEEILLTECPWAKLGSKRHLPVTGTESSGRFGGRALRGDALGAGTSIIFYTLRSNRRDILRESLQNKSIQTGIHYAVPAHLQPAYANLGYGRGSRLSKWDPPQLASALANDRSLQR